MTLRKLEFPIPDTKTDPENNLKFGIFNWDTLRQIQKQVASLQNINKFWHYGFCDYERICARICDDAIKQINQFNKWFLGNEVKKHGYRDEAIEFRKNATLDITKLMLIIEPDDDHTFEYLINGAPEIENFIHYFHDKRKECLSVLRTEYQKIYDNCYELWEEKFKLNEKNKKDQKEIVEQQSIVKGALHEGLDHEETSFSALKKIKARIVYDENKDASPLAITTYKTVLGIIEKSLQLPKSNKTSDIKQADLISSNLRLAPPLLPSPLKIKKLEKPLLSKEFILSVCPRILAIQKTLEWRSFDFLSIEFSGESERKIILNYIKIFMDHKNELNKPYGQNEAALEKVNTAFFELIAKLNETRRSVDKAEDLFGGWSIMPHYYELLILYRIEIRKQFDLIQIEYCHAQQQQKQLQDEMVLFKQKEAKFSEDSSRLPMRFFIVKACQEQTKRKKPYEDALREIMLQIKFVELTIQNQALYPLLVKLFEDISKHINTALELLPPPAEPAFSAKSAFSFS
jgi:hypothetical protein